MSEQTQTEQSETEQAGKELSPLARQLFWLVPVLAATIGVTVFLFRNREWGADAAAIVSVPLGISAIIVAILSERGVFGRRLRVPRNRRRTWRWVAGFTVVALLITVVGWWTRREPNPFDYMSGEVRVGYVNFGYRGWHTDVSSGEQGFDVDLARAIETHFKDTRIVWVDLINLGNRIPALRGEWTNPSSGVKQKPVKLVVSNFSMTPERAEQIDFVGPYFVDTQAFLSRNNATSITDVPVSRVCVVKNSRSAQKLIQTGWNPMEVDSLALCIHEYRAGRVDAVSHDRSLLAPHAKDLKVELSSPLSYGAEKYGVAIPNNMPRLCAEIRKVIEDFLLYGWSNSFQTNLAPFGLSEDDYTRPRSTDPCQLAGPWYD